MDTVFLIVRPFLDVVRGLCVSVTQGATPEGASVVDWLMGGDWGRGRIPGSNKPSVSVRDQWWTG